MISEDRLKQSQEDISFFKRKANKLLADVFADSTWYPECHNNPEKIKCDHCLNCWDIQCNRTNCDRKGRCLCRGTDCICLGR